MLYQSNYNSRWCSSYHFSSACKSSAKNPWWHFCDALQRRTKKSITIWSVVLKSEEWLVLFQSYYNSRWCSSYHFSSACKCSATRAAWWKFRSRGRILMKKTNRNWSLACLLWRQKISENILYRFNKSPWCSGYHICLTRRGSAVQARMVTFLWCIAKADEKSGSVSDQLFRSLKTD